MSSAPIAAHLRDILILPFSVVVIVPYFLYDSLEDRILENIFFTILGVFIAGAGMFLFFYTVFLFKKIGKGTLAPWSEKQQLVIVGPYRYCRNPMISGVLFIIIAEALLLHSRSILIWAACFFVINTIYFIVFEEPALEKKFGLDYKQYKHQVSRWLPRVKPYHHHPSGA